MTTWNTTAITLLPAGWNNTYQESDGTTWSEACPALLLQEVRHISYVRDDGGNNIQHVTIKTRVIAAVHDRGELEPVDYDGMPTSYLGLTGADDTPTPGGTP